jgi:hypothetical protein
MKRDAACGVYMASQAFVYPDLRCSLAADG